LALKPYLFFYIILFLQYFELGNSCAIQQIYEFRIVYIVKLIWELEQNKEAASGELETFPFSSMLFTQIQLLPDKRPRSG
jgi:hypothetical protein